MPASVGVDVHGRWDVLALSQRLVPYHSYLVERGREHWRVHAEAPGRPYQPPARAGGSA